jgi:hydrogenase-4 membrane subunit HyfE
MPFYTPDQDADDHTNDALATEPANQQEGKFMSDKMMGYLLLTLSVLIYVVCAATFLAMLQALTVSSTISAIESAFGTFVIGILLLVLGRKSYKAGKRRLKAEN